MLILFKQKLFNKDVLLWNRKEMLSVYPVATLIGDDYSYYSPVCFEKIYFQ